MKKLAEKLFVIFGFHILVVLTTRMSSIDYANNYSLKNALFDAIKGRTPLFTFLICGFFF
jgi:hypothetical protein